MPLLYYQNSHFCKILFQNYFTAAVNLKIC